MSKARIEHVNVTVSDPDRAARLMQDVFGWQVRWQGPARAGGRTVHVGTDDQYLAFYAGRDGPGSPDGFAKGRPLNHVAMLVDDLDETEAKVIAAGLTPFEHGDYEPGRRFYFYDPDGIEFEVVSYQPADNRERQLA
jgi:catechol 2,3-dioxygenase-like lactoylglutathione lyase family enzyme